MVVACWLGRHVHAFSSSDFSLSLFLPCSVVISLLACVHVRRRDPERDWCAGTEEQSLGAPYEGRSSTADAPGLVCIAVRSSRQRLYSRRIHHEGGKKLSPLL